ncbi:iron-sulfur cluster co-chaperone protein HscB [Diabrotica undecimpunctata]|uniref:iron-sulfur cluster co-chaperone protein HscB n=1 Tax=Diabrotica undecimpunctata TaxID=50387 RepID=UPI003B63CC8B
MKRTPLIISHMQRFFYNTSTHSIVTKNQNVNVSFLGTSSSQISLNYCWKCGAERKGSNIFCEKCNVIQVPKEKSNYFKVLEIQETFNVDQKLLKEKFRSFQSYIHPDKFSNSTSEEQHISEEYSSLINKAFSNLLSPLKRAEHLLHLRGESIAEGQTIDEPEFLMKIMELNEEIEEAEHNVDKLKQLDVQNKKQLDKLIKDIDEHFKNGNLEEAKKTIIKFKYFSSINSRINSIFREAGVVD